MKKQILLLGCSALILASCGSNNNKQEQTQAQIDSTVNAKMAEHDAANAAKNDSTLKAIEAEKAAAAAKEREAEHAGKKHEGGKKEEQPTAAATPAPPPPPPPPPPPAVNVRPGATGPKSVNDRPGAH